MKLVLICAMEAEAEGFRSHMTDVRLRQVAGLAFSQGQLWGQEVAVVTSGVGKVQAARCAQAAILIFQPELLIHVGVAGGVGRGIKTGDVVVASDLVEYDFDLSGLNEGVGQFCSCDGATSRALFSAAQQVLDSGQAYLGRIATGDTFVADSVAAARLRDTFGALACEMEGAAVARVCEANQVPCGVVRAISDNANESAGADYPSFLAAAGRKTERMLAVCLGGGMHH